MSHRRIIQLLIRLQPLDNLFLIACLVPLHVNQTYLLVQWLKIFIEFATDRLTMYFRSIFQTLDAFNCLIKPFSSRWIQLILLILVCQVATLCLIYWIWWIHTFVLSHIFFAWAISRWNIIGLVRLHVFVVFDVGVSYNLGVSVLVVAPDLLVRNENESIDGAVVGGVLAEVANQIVRSVLDELVDDYPLGALVILWLALLVKLLQVFGKAQDPSFR